MWSETDRHAQVVKGSLLHPGHTQLLDKRARAEMATLVAEAVATLVRGFGGVVAVLVDAETIRCLAEAVGQLLEHEQADRQHWIVPGAMPARLLVAVDGMHTPSVQLPFSWMPDRLVY